MNQKDKDYLLPIVDNEGFDYAFRKYSSFEEIEDPEFHKLREAYKDAAQRLVEYIGLEEY